MSGFEAERHTLTGLPARRPTAGGIVQRSIIQAKARNHGERMTGSSIHRDPFPPSATTVGAQIVQAFTGARANPRRSRASFPGVVGPEQGNEPAKPVCAAKTRSAVQKSSFRTGIFTRFSNSVCYARRVSQTIGERHSPNFSQCTVVGRCSRVPVDAIDTSRKLGATSILLLLQRGNFFLGAADLRFSSAAQGQKFFLTPEI
jgi:hypothetical protein